jgi:hypothetical protein
MVNFNSTVPATYITRSNRATSNIVTTSVSALTALSDNFMSTTNTANSSNLPSGAQYSSTASSPNQTQTVVEDRAIIYDQTGLFAKTSPMMKPLADLSGVVFPITPTISTSHRVNYEMEQVIHSNYATPYYTNSMVDNISVVAMFVCQTPDEAAYIDAMKHFFRTATKMFYGQSTSNVGMPPPILFLDAYGKMAYDHIPVLVKDFDYVYPPDVDYISSDGNQWSMPATKVPVTFNITLNLVPTYSRNAISSTFGLNQYANGTLLTSGTGSRNGGWI